MFAEEKVVFSYDANFSMASFTRAAAALTAPASVTSKTSE